VNDEVDVALSFTPPKEVRPKRRTEDWCYLCGVTHHEDCPLTPEQREVAIAKRLARGR
jgi:hypothetical protein